MNEGATKRVVVALVLVLAVGISYVSYMVGQKISYSEQVELLDLLLAVASVVFAVTGIWLAVVFPESVTRIYEAKNTAEKDNQLSSSKRLLLPLIAAVSAFVLVVLIRIGAVVVKSINLQFGVMQLKGVCFLAIVLSALLLLYSLLLAAMPGVKMWIDASRSARKAKRVERLKSRR